jgi:hypothetical protein
VTKGWRRHQNRVTQAAVNQQSVVSEVRHTQVICQTGALARTYGAKFTVRHLAGANILDMLPGDIAEPYEPQPYRFVFTHWQTSLYIAMQTLPIAAV